MPQNPHQAKIIIQSLYTVIALEVVARDQGPGIDDISQAMQDGFSTSRSLGLGLPGSRRLMDEFRVQSKIGHGTTVIMRKWLPSNRSKHCCFS
jgi:anti-sigma regulatory factor (Ser/Thr protein kinase)